MKKSISLSIVLWLAANTFSHAAESAKEDPTYLDPKSAPADYAYQGEYEGKVGDSSVGIHIIALGDGKFHGVLYPGGLPGAGFTGEKKIEGDSELKDGKLTFKGKNDAAYVEVSDGKITGKTGDGEPISLTKVTRTSPTLGAKPPKDAIVLFDGTNADAWVNGHTDDQKRLAPGIKSKQAFKDFKLHVEFYLPFKPFARGQGRGNSGVYLQDRYEVQVLDSFGLAGLNNECGGIYTKAAPSVNMCYPPLTWQTYDIDFTAARYDAGGMKVKNALATVKHNGVTIHDQVEINGPTGGGQKETDTPGVIQLQGHGNPVFYRNIWVVEKK